MYVTTNVNTLKIFLLPPMIKTVKNIFIYLVIHSIKSETIPSQALTRITLKFSMKHDASLFKLIPLPAHLPCLLCPVILLFLVYGHVSRQFSS